MTECPILQDCYLILRRVNLGCYIEEHHKDLEEVAQAIHLGENIFLGGYLIGHVGWTPEGLKFSWWI
ncbi:hypothetical protein Lal_00041556 [Lupinus albus]|nr:hypothetical protein Lal_00041556 [Lupinus albus]